MKKILFLAVSAILLAASCQKTEIINQAPGESLTFAPYLGKLTKAAENADLEDGKQHLKDQDFYVWAYADFEDELNGKPDLDQIYDNINGVKVENDDNNKWKTDLDYYWPGQNKKLNFFAVSGIDDPTTVNIQINRSENQPNPSLSIANYVADGETDLMVADFVNQAQNNGETSTKQVNLNFRHTLSKVQFLFKTETSTSSEDNDQVLVQHITVANVKTTANLTVAKNADEKTNTLKPYLATWTEPSSESDSTTLTEDYDGDGLENAAEETDFDLDIQWINSNNKDYTAMKLGDEAEPFATWLLMPQTIVSDDFELNVKVLYLMGKRQIESTFVLNSTNLKRWGENQYIRYIITLTPNKITFVPDVKDWEAEDVEMGN